jgi:ABC-type iron transport system FetAB ATPase subunit
MTLHFTNEEQELIEKEKREVHFQSKLCFLNAHNGLRRGSMHLVLGTTGGGKSTLIRTILRDLLFVKDAEYQVAVWLTEEDLKDYRAEVAFGLPSSDRLLNSHAISELEGDHITELYFFEWLEMIQPDILIMDNITTSKFYNDKKPYEQSRFASKLKNITKKINIATVVVAHTDAKATDSMGRTININDVRGSKSIANLVEFAYILQRFELNETFFPTIRVVKHRSQDLVHSLFYLEYDKRFRLFSGDKAIDFNKFKEVYDARNKLGK